MAKAGRVGLVLLMCVLLLAVGLPAAEAQLRFNYYFGKCPDQRLNVEAIVRRSIRASLNQDNTLVGGLIRMLFHDAMVNGPDGSILLNGSTSERTARVNGALHGFEAIDAAKAAVEALCPGIVSCADILSYAARDVIFLARGPLIRLQGGRRDGIVSEASSIGGQIPGPQMHVPELAAAFAAKGLNLQDLVVLSGAHTVGGARCRTFQNRLFAFNSTVATDPNLNPALAAQLKDECPLGENLDVRIPMDRTPLFDNSYYVQLTQGKGIFVSDDSLFLDPSTSSFVKFYASRFGGRRWRRVDFPTAFRKLLEVGPTVGSNGQIRTICSQVNQ